MDHAALRYKIKAALTPEEYSHYQAVINNMAKDAITWRNLLQERVNMDVADSFQMITGTPFPKAKIKDLVEWTEDAEVALHGSEEEAD